MPAARSGVPDAARHRAAAAVDAARRRAGAGRRSAVRAHRLAARPGGRQAGLPLLDGQPGFSFAHQAGPVSLMVADLRSERSQEQVMGPASWDAMQRWLAALPAGAARAPRHLLFMSSVPVVHPKLSLAEAFMDSFGQDHVLDSSADDLRITGPTTTTKASAGAWSRPCCAPPGTAPARDHRVGRRTWRPGAWSIARTWSRPTTGRRSSS